MKTNDALSVVVFAFALILGIAISDSQVVPAAEESLAEPLMIAQTVSVKKGATAIAVQGTCYLIRKKLGSHVMRGEEAIHEGDVFDMADDCSLTIRSHHEPDLVLRRENGRFFKVTLRK